MSDMKERAFQAHITEFEAMRDEINLHLGHQNHMMNYAIAIIAGSASLFVFGEPGQPNIARQEPYLLLIASILMSGISWSFMEASLQINDLGRYLHSNLVPKIQVLIGESSEKHFKVMAWEESKITHALPRLLMRGITATGKFLIAYIPSIAYIVIFYSLKPPSLLPWTTGESIFFWSAVGSALVLPLGGIINVPFLMRFNIKDSKTIKNLKISRSNKRNAKVNRRKN